MLNIIPDLSYTEHNIPLWFLAYHVIETKVSLPNKPQENIKNAFKRANQISVYHALQLTKNNVFKHIF